MQKIRLFLVLVMVLVASGSVFAAMGIDPPYDEDVVISFSATNGTLYGGVDLYIGSEEWTLLNPQDDPSEHRWEYVADVATDIIDMGTLELIGSIDSFNLVVKVDPSVSLNFSATASGAATTFGFSSSIVSFSPMTNPDAVASASITVTDNNGDGASVAGAFAGGEMYQALYNSPAVTWAQLLNSTVIAGGYSSNTANDRRPASGLEQIMANVSSISSAYNFTLSANDSASGTSTFTVLPHYVPEPLTVALFGLGALLIRKRA